jgi:hypothetical protein
LKFQALFCFGRADDKRGKSLANAFLEEKQGNSNINYDADLAEESFRKAIKLFRECELPLREAACYEKLGDFETSAGGKCRNPSSAGHGNRVLTRELQTFLLQTASTGEPQSYSTG